MNFSKTRTRFPPSPTGPLHIGGARTALFNYVFARQNKGDFILRIEDTDEQRSDERFEKDITDGLRWLGISYDEFYRQSERKEIYKKYTKKLLKNGNAFWCYHSTEELNEEKTIQMQNKEAPRHVCGHKFEIRNSKFETKDRGVIRLRGSDKKIKFNDLIRGDIEYNGALLGDFAIAKNEETPLYNLAVVIDDYEMRISHVLRGEDHIPNTPKQILIQEALGIEKPLYAHIPLVLGTDRSKLSKRHGAISVNEYHKIGYLSDAFVNFMALLGWNPGGNKEIINRKSLIKMFSLAKIQKGGAVFNMDKLNWFNKEYIKRAPVKKLSGELMKYLPQEWQVKIKKDRDYWKKIIELERIRLTKLSEIKEGVGYFFDKPNPTKSLLIWKPDQTNESENLNKTAKHLDTLIELLSDLQNNFDAETIRKSIWDYAEKNGKGNVLWPLRVALTGRAESPDPFSVAEILGKEESLRRINYAKNMIYGNPTY